MGGYAAVYGQETTLWEIPGFIRVREEIAPNAFKNVLERIGRGEEIVHFNHGHDMKTAVAATDVQGIGSLELGEDSHGLRFFARVDQEDMDARQLAVKMRRNIVRQSSFAFTIADEERVATETDDFYDVKYTINEIGHLYDVCACAQGAYPQTEVGLRSLAAASMRVPDLSEIIGRIKRADVAALDLLTDAYQDVENFIAIETDPEDAGDIEIANQILDLLDGLIVAEANEPNDGAEVVENSGRAKAGRPRRGKPGANLVTGTGEAGQRTRELLQLQAYASTFTRKRKVST